MLSLILWSLLIVVSIKYLAFVMRADNRGEGGILALVALILQRNRREGEQTRRKTIIAVGLIGAALLYGDGIITPAISVLGATEGLSVVSPVLGKLSVIVTLVILTVLFFFQKHGTGRVGLVFGPITLVWFLTIATLGVAEIIREPQILAAVNPWYGVTFFIRNGFHAFVILGAVVLVVTGAEALYADMGHFGRRPIRLAWFALVLPSLVLNYFGQGGLLLRDPTAAMNPFYMLAPRILLYPLIALATMAAIIASQALISGAFSLTHQCVQLGYCPRVTIVHTSKDEHGQIYIPEVNWALMIGCLLVVLGFRTSSNLGAAYGIAVTGTFAITTLLLSVVARQKWGWSLAKTVFVAAVFLTIDLAFFGANILKIAQGGWVPLVAAAAIFLLMTTWNHGRAIIQEILSNNALPFELFLPDLAKRKPARVPGVAVFMARDASGVPGVLMHHLKHNKVLHETVVLLSVQNEEVPTVPEQERVEVTPLEAGFFRIRARYGFLDSPNVPWILAQARDAGISGNPMDTTYYLGREQLIPMKLDKEELSRRKAGDMKVWRKRLFGFMSRNSRTATQFFQIPPNRVVELGAQIPF